MVNTGIAEDSTVLLLLGSIEFTSLFRGSFSIAPCSFSIFTDKKFSRLVFCELFKRQCSYIDKSVTHPDVKPTIQIKFKVRGGGG